MEQQTTVQPNGMDAIETPGQETLYRMQVPDAPVGAVPPGNAPIPLRPGIEKHGPPPPGTPTAKSFGGGPMPTRNYPKRIMWLTLPFYGWHILAWVNAPDKIIDDMQRRMRGVRSPDDPRIDPDDPEIDPFDFALDPDAYGISETERAARAGERERREREIARRREEQARRQEAFDRAKADLARLLGEIVMEHDIPDLDGNLIPADDPALWEFLEGEPQSVIMATINGQRGKLNPTNARR